jgi:subtilase family serine protease
LRSIYHLSNLNEKGIVAIVDAYDYPTALNDFNTFSGQYGLRQQSSPDVTSPTNAVFQVVYAGGTKPAANSDWSLEAALDIEYAHAMAPDAKILLVEANSSSRKDMFAAVRMAGHIIGQTTNMGEVSMSWECGTWAGETQYDTDFQKKNVVYFAASGDTGGVPEYPSTSPNVVSVGGTTVMLNQNGSFASETGWSGSGGGIDTNETMPSYQQVLSAKLNGHRGVPDVSFDADPGSGVFVYTTTPYGGETGWFVIGGTSLACPCVAGLVNSAGHFKMSSLDELQGIYGALGSANFRDIVQGTAGSFSCSQGWDFVTGCGSPIGSQSRGTGMF